MGRRRSADFKQYWHEKSLGTAEGRVTWCVINDPENRNGPFIAWFKLDHRPEHWSTGKRLLAEGGHPDAALDAVGEKPGKPLTGPPLRSAERSDA